MGLRLSLRRSQAVPSAEKFSAANVMILTIVVFPSWVSTTAEIKGKIRSAQTPHRQKKGAFRLHSATTPTWDKSMQGSFPPLVPRLHPGAAGGGPGCLAGVYLLLLS